MAAGDRRYGEDKYWNRAGPHGTLNITQTMPEREWTKGIFLQEMKVAPWENERSIIHTVKISSGVSLIHCRAFANCTALDSINIPNSVTIIREGAFSHCIGLSGVSIPSGATVIGESAFNGCHSVESITVPAGVTRIEDKTFKNCLSLERVTIPAGITHIGREAFKGCMNLTDVHYGGSEEQWRQLSIDNGNEPLTRANVHFNS